MGFFLCSSSGNMPGEPPYKTIKAEEKATGGGKTTEEGTPTEGWETTGEGKPTGGWETIEGKPSGGETDIVCLNRCNLCISLRSY